MKSMTGFGQARLQGEESNYEVNVKTVNGRFLEVRFHAPREMVSLEPELKKLLSEHFMRGTVDIFISRRMKTLSAPGKVMINEDLAKDYLKAFTQLSKKLKIKCQPTLELLTRQPDIVRLEDTGDYLEKDKKAVLQAFRKAMEACAAEREREGLALKKEMQKILGQLEEHVAQITSLREEANKTLQDRFIQKIENRLKATSTEVDQQRLMQEIVLQLEKSDINEELQRLEEHIKNYKKMLVSVTSEGKKMDFYTQELLREVNTIGSKSQVAKLTQAVVEAKTMIERLREQVQNIE